MPENLKQTGRTERGERAAGLARAQRLPEGREEGEEVEGEGEEEEGAGTWVTSAAPLAAPALLKGLACQPLRLRDFFAFVFAFAFAFVVLLVLGA